MQTTTKIVRTQKTKQRESNMTKHNRQLSHKALKLERKQARTNKTLNFNFIAQA